MQMWGRHGELFNCPEIGEAHTFLAAEDSLTLEFSDLPVGWKKNSFFRCKGKTSLRRGMNGENNGKTQENEGKKSIYKKYYS